MPGYPPRHVYAATWRAFTYLLLFWILTIPTNPNPVQLRIILRGAARTGKYRAIDGPGARSALVPALTRRTVRASGASDLSDSARQQNGVCPKRARVSTTTARVYRKVRKFAFGDRGITAGPKLPRYARTVRTQGFSVQAYLPRDGLSDGRVLTGGVET